MSNIFNNSEFANIINIIHTLHNPKAIAKANANPIDFFAEHGVSLPKDIAYEIHLNNQHYFYFVIPSPPNATLSDEQMKNIMAASKAKTACISSISSVSSAGTVSCPFTSSSTMSSGSSASTADLSENYKFIA